MRNYLEPRPSSSDRFPDWETVQNQGYSILDETKAKELLLEVNGWEVHMVSLERLLLVVSAFRHSCLNDKKQSVAKKLFVVSKGNVAITIFDYWRRRAQALLTVRLEQKKPVQGTLELYLLAEILHLIADCKIIRTPKNLNDLKLRGLDWVKGIEEVSPTLCQTVAFRTSFLSHFDRFVC
jgi:hypothetical protein